MNILKVSRLSPTETFSLGLGPCCLVFSVFLLSLSHKIYAFAFLRHIKKQKGSQQWKPLAKGTAFFLVPQAHVARRTLIFTPSCSIQFIIKSFQFPYPSPSSHYLISVLLRYHPFHASIHSVLQQSGNSCYDTTDVSFYWHLCENAWFPFLL